MRHGRACRLTFRLLVVAAVPLGLARPASAATDLVFNDVFPCRLVDTRNGSGASDEAAGVLPNPGPHSFRVQGFCGVPNGAAAAVLNFAVLSPTAAGDLRAFPFGGSAVVSVMNFRAGIDLANGATVPLDPVGAPADRDLSVLIGMVESGNIHLLIDVTGYYSDGDASFLPLSGGTLTGPLVGAAGRKSDLFGATPTPSAHNATVLTINSGTTITDLTSGIDGQCVVLVAHIAVTVQDNDATIELAGDTDFAMTLKDTLTLCRVGATWYETSRSVI